MIESPLLKPTIESADLLLCQKLTFDKIIEMLGINRFNVRVFFFIALFFMADGSEMVVLSLLLNKLDELWKLTSFQKATLGSSIFIGFTIGSLSSGYISDRKGRRPAYLIGASLVLVFAVASSFAQGFFSFIILRIVCGFGIGIAVPALFALATELTPTYYRSLVLNNVWSVFPIGASFVIIMTKYFIDDENGWRYVLLFASLPCFILLLFSHNVPESPRFHMSNGNYEKAFEELDKIIKFAKMDDRICIGEQDQQNLISEAEDHQLNKKEANYKILFSPEYLRLTLLVCTIYFIVSLNYYGATYILPQIFKELYDNDRNNVGDVYISLLIGYFLEVPTCFLAGYLANNRFLYRVKTMSLGFLLSLIACILILLFPYGVTLSAAFFKASMILPFNVLFVYACEAYPTKIRSMGVGLGNSCTRFAAIITPFISQLLFDWYPKLPFLLYGIGSVAGIISCFALPFETYNLVLK